MSNNPTPHSLIQDLDDILTFSHEILAMINEANSQKPIELPVLSQVLMRRGNLIAQIEQTVLAEALSEPSTEERFKKGLEAINAIEPQVQEALNGLREEIKTKLDATIHDKQAVHLYKLSSTEGRSTRSDRA